MINTKQRLNKLYKKQQENRYGLLPCRLEIYLTNKNASQNLNRSLYEKD